MNIRQAVIKHAASPSNPPKGYGLDKGLKVAAYRSELWDKHHKHHKRLGVAELHQFINNAVLSKFGPPS